MKLTKHIKPHNDFDFDNLDTIRVSFERESKNLTKTVTIALADIQIRREEVKGVARFVNFDGKSKSLPTLVYS